jgi:hypothetical protein
MQVTHTEQLWNMYRIDVRLNAICGTVLSGAVLNHKSDLKTAEFPTLSARARSGSHTAHVRAPYG